MSPMPPSTDVSIIKAEDSIPSVPLNYKTTFHRNFEKTHGFLTVDQFPPIDWAVKSQIEELFPAYQRSFLALKGKAPPGGAGNIEVDFSLKSPYGGDDLFVNTTLTIQPGKRSAVYGENGSGKTSLFEAINNGGIPDFPKHIHVHHMKELEHNEEADKVSVLDTVLCSHPFRRVLLPIKEQLTILVASEKDDVRRASLQSNLDYVQAYLVGLRSDSGTDRARGMLRVLGFDETGEKAPLSSLSGGLRMRVALASAFFIDAQILLLDEPTNHLDMPSVLWLENKLRGYKGAYLLVTHDRTLLENVVTSVMLLQDYQIQYFPCSFADFEKRKKKLDADRERMTDKFLAANRNIDPCSTKYPIYKKYKIWSDAFYQRKLLLQSKFTFKAPKELPLPAGITVQADIPLITVKDVRFSYDVQAGLPFIFDEPISYEIKLGTRVGIMGPNGAGKSTFLKLITGKIHATEGSIITNPNYTLAYFGQHSTKELSLDLTPLEFMERSFPKANRGDLKSQLAKTSITENNANTRMMNLSFSQRSCVIFAKLTFVPPHLLIMDEPTNFLDLDSVDSLIMAANKFSGALIVVTHNRTFLRKCGKAFLSIVPGVFKEYETMKEAERATYSFISALESGKDIDVKNAITQNRGGGAAMTEEERAIRDQALTEQQLAAKLKADQEQAAIDEAARLVAEKEEKLKAKVAAQKTDWVAGDKCFVFEGGKWQNVVVLRNVPSMGVTVTLSSGKNIMVNANKLKETSPQGSDEAPTTASKTNDGPKNTGKATGGRGGGRGGGAPRGGGGQRGGGQRGGRGGGRG